MSDESAVLSQFSALLPSAGTGRALKSLILATICKPGFLGFPSCLLLLRGHLSSSSSGLGEEIFDLSCVSDEAVGAVTLLEAYACGDVRSAYDNVEMKGVNSFGIANLIQSAMINLLSKYINERRYRRNKFSTIPLADIVKSINKAISEGKQQNNNDNNNDNNDNVTLESCEKAFIQLIYNNHVTGKIRHVASSSPLLRVRAVNTRPGPYTVDGLIAEAEALKARAGAARDDARRRREEEQEKEAEAAEEERRRQARVDDAKSRAGGGAAAAAKEPGHGTPGKEGKRKRDPNRHAAEQGDDG
mmetsp:Transcript_11448/g.22806  ORF Transcript_11448/g.22806 Transcript_11448/m.22806 type:complete len:302 (+) Transcript_11448:47-952(+)